MILGWFWGRKRCIRLKNLKVSPKKRKRGTTITFPSRLIKFHKKTSKKSSKSIRGVAKIENRFFPERFSKIIRIPLVKQGFANQWKRMRKALEGLQKWAFFAKRARKGSGKHYTVCKNHIGNHFSEIHCNTCRFLCVLESENDKKMYPESIILCAKVTSWIIFLKCFVILAVS